MDYQELNEQILENIGGKKNINALAHCMTRFRFKLKDESKANTEAIKKIPGVVTVVQSGGQYQIVIGNHVGEVYKEFVELAGIKDASTSENDVDKPKGILNKFIDIVSGVFTPVINVLMAAGMIKGLLALLAAFELIDKTSGTYLILNATGDGLFYFFPLFLGYTASSKFGGKPFIGMAIGAALVYPSIVAANSAGGEALFTLFQGTVIESPVYIKFLGLPVILMNYASSVIPIIAGTYLAAKFEDFLTRVIPRMVRSFFVSFLTLIITVPLIFLVVGPITTWVGLFLGQMLSAANDFSPIIAGIVIGGFWQVFIMFGLHWGFVPIAMNNYATLGYDVVMMAGLATPLAMAGVTFAVFFKTKNKRLKEIAFPAALSAVFGITEPALYGVTLARKKVFYTTSLAVAIAGAIMGIFNTRVYINGGTGIFALPRFINPEVGFDNSFIGFAIACGVAFVVGFLITYFYSYNPKLDEETDEVTEKESIPVNAALGQTVLYELDTPIKGEVIPLSKVSDTAFSTGLLGQGVAILPTEGKVYAPADGKVTTLFPTYHALGLTTDEGIELLIHIGMDTVNLQGKYFDPAVKQGDTVRKGQLLLIFDIDAIAAAGYSLQTPVIIANSKHYLEVVSSEEKNVNISNNLFTVIA
ncbi:MULTISPECIES: beta-glucoside-specific PTS transporter subunit IIABC [unclassified Enterococcus]|uniref:beta-glucoside-specific PTS transporter subunit IIABC n=1 Tax=unclassified Enterococcus TaxID=2608891 RepID=UPI001A927BD1|nr:MULTISPECIES: beta-glucoside-specific PTS transporter subunit IIABC [unclassified Enterococcus]MBO0460152.1 PTS glucose transporter subunit IIA [Enterococcus sp. DIV1298c]MBO1300328.1 PTS glucose transporter subunit IIA [Enterococcus sp. DIV1271a]